jgi:hypothetical protein
MSKKKTVSLGRTDILDMTGYVAKVPTKVLTAVRGFTNITTKLYGPVDDARLALEQRIIDYRAEQLTPVPKRPERIVREPFQYIGNEEAKAMKRDRAEVSGHRKY